MLLGIFLSVLGTCSSSSALIIWSFLVLGTLSSVVWLKTKTSTGALSLYFLVSVLGSLLFLLGCSIFFFSDLVLQLALTLKCGLAPFQFWVHKVLRSLDVGSLCFFLGPLKFGLLWLIVNLSYPSLVLGSSSLFLGLLMLWLSSSLHIVLFASGSCQLLILLLLGSSFYPSYNGIYILALLGVFCYSKSLVSALFAFLSLGALPPLTMFWAKVLAISVLPLHFAILVLLISLLCLCPYLRCCLVLNHCASTSVLPALILTSIPMSVALRWI